MTQNHVCHFCGEETGIHHGYYYLGKWICDECAKLLQDELALALPAQHCCNCRCKE